MFLIYFIGSFLIGGILLFNRVRAVKISLLFLFVVLQVFFTVFVCRNIGTGFGYLTADPLAVLFVTILAVLAPVSIYHSSAYLNWRRMKAREHNFYYAALVILVAALSCAYCANHIAITWVFVEITTIAASFLVYYHRTELTLEGTWKYIFVCSISITLVFIGILFMSIALNKAGLTDMSYAALRENAAILDPFWTKMSFLFIFTGFTAKAGLFPMYTAGIDAKDKSPAPAGALFSSALMNVGFCGIYRCYQVVHPTTIGSWVDSLLIISAVISIFIAAVYMMKVTNYKRMFAYSSIEHMGLVMLGLAMGGIGIFAALLHLVLHSFVKAAMFYQMGIAYRVFGSKVVDGVGGYFRIYTTGALVFLLGFFCVIAVPPSGLFISEFLIFKSMFQGGYLWAMILVMSLLTVIIWAFGKNIFRMIFIPPTQFDIEKAEHPSPFESLTQLALLLFVIIMGICPPEGILWIIREAAAGLGR